MPLMQNHFQTDEILAATGAKVIPASSEVQVTVSGLSTDTRTVAAGDLFVALEGERFDGHAFLVSAAEAGARAAVVRRDHPAIQALEKLPGELLLFGVEDTLQALGDLARFHRRRFVGLPVVAITGSNGKTTTRALCQAALEASLGAGHATKGNFNNLVGLPQSLLELQQGDAFSVLEMGMNASGEIARLTQIAEPGVGLVTNAAGVHLEGLGSVEGVARAKAELYEGLPEGAVAIANADDALLLPLARAAARTRGLKLVTFGRDPEADLRVLEVIVRPDGGLRVTLAPGQGDPITFGLGLLGTHNALNAAAALAVAWALGADLPRAAAALEAVVPVGRRLRRTRCTTGATLLDDCYNANLVSMQAALETAGALAALGGGRILAALGDMLELGDESDALHRQLGTLAAEAGVDRLVAFGPLSVATHEGAEGIAHLLHTEDPAEAAAFLVDTGPEDVVLVKGSRGMQMERIVRILEP